MPSLEKSIFAVLDDATREELLTEYAWCRVQQWEPQRVFSSVASDAWWVPPAGFRFIPELLESSGSAALVSNLEDQAAMLAGAVYPARRQHASVVDVCMIFLAENIDALSTLCLFQRRLPSLQVLNDTAVIQTVSDYLAGNPMADDWLPEELTEQLRDEFPDWAPDFILQLLQWKWSPENTRIESVADDELPSAGADGVSTP